MNVKQSDLQAGKYNVILGEQLAGQLGVNRGDKIRVMVPSASQFTPMGRVPSQRLFTVIGTFAANSEVDGYQMLTNIDDASRLMRYPLGNITGWRLWLDQPLQVDTLSQQTLPPGTQWQDWRERKGELFRGGAHGEKYDGPAAEPDRRRRGLQHYYLAGDDGDGEAGRSGDPPDPGADAAADYGRLYGAGGPAPGSSARCWGAVLGALLASQLNNLMPIIGAFLDGAALPVAIEPLQVIVIALGGDGAGPVVYVVPFRRAAATQPAEALRYE